MNEHGLPPDELASAFLDDMLAEAEADAVRADPNLAARAEELRRTTEAVGAPADPPAGAADAAVAAALADYEARRVTRLDTAQQRRTRSFRLITAVAATVAVGFVVAAAIGLFAEQTQDDGDATAAPAAAPEPAPEPPAADMASAAAEPAAPPPAPAAEPPAAAEFAASPPATTLPSPDIAMSDGGEAAVAQPGAALEEAQVAADLARATVAGNEAAVAQAEAALTDAQAEAAAAQAEAAAAPAAPASTTESTEQAAAAPPPAPAPPTPPADGAMEDMPAMDDSGDDMDGDMDDSGDDMGDMDDSGDDMGDMGGDMDAADGTSADVPTDPSPESCAAEIADGTIELQITAAGTPILIVRTPDGRTAALDATTCAKIAPDDPTEMTVDPPPDGCAAAVGDGTIELQITAAGTPILIVRTPDGRTAALDATTCAEIAPEEPPDTSGDGTGDAAGPPLDSPT